jgi:hypothetical protein
MFREGITTGRKGIKDTIKTKRTCLNLGRFSLCSVTLILYNGYGWNGDGAHRYLLQPKQLVLLVDELAYFVCGRVKSSVLLSRGQVSWLFMHH